VADGNVIAVAPANPTAIFKDGITSFRIEMANTAANRGKTAAVNLVGVNNEFADKIWMMQNPNNPEGWQDIVFYIPPVTASAAFSFTADPDDPEPPAAGVKIQKIDALTRENISGALMRLRGMTAMTLVTGDGQSFTVNNTGVNLSQVLTAGAETAAGDEIISTVSDGVWAIEGLPYGFYMAEEERAPENYSLLPQHTAYGFWVVPPNITINAEGIPVISTESETVSGEGFYSSVYVETVDHIDVEYEIVLSENPTSVLVTFSPVGKSHICFGNIRELPVRQNRSGQVRYGVGSAPCRGAYPHTGLLHRGQHQRYANRPDSSDGQRRQGRFREPARRPVHHIRSGSPCGLSA
jgi:hypothetical protein